MSNTWTKTIALVTMFCMFLTADVYAGPGSGAKPKKMGFFAKIGSAIKTASQKAATAVKNAAQKAATAVKTAAKKTGMAIKTAGAKVVNAGMDTGVWAKQKLFGKKNKVWVCGHYDKNGKWIKGHWRKLNAAKPSAGGNTANQGNYTDQGNYGDASGSADSGSQETAAEPNTDAGMSGDGNSYEESNTGDAASESGSETGDMPVAGEDPVLPELPGNDNQQSEQSEQSEQTSQESEQTTQSEEADQGKEFSYDNEVSMRTMGMLMNDIIKQSQSINTFKKSANANISYSVEVQEDINTTYESREDDASLLSRIVVWDVRTNNGEAGKYFKFFVEKMNKTTPENRKLVKDVVEQIKSGIVHEINNASGSNVDSYQQRLSELSKY